MYCLSTDRVLKAEQNSFISQTSKGSGEPVYDWEQKMLLDRKTERGCLNPATFSKAFFLIGGYAHVQPVSNRLDNGVACHHVERLVAKPAEAACIAYHHGGCLAQFFFFWRQIGVMTLIPYVKRQKCITAQHAPMQVRFRAIRTRRADERRERTKRESMNDTIRRYGMAAALFLALPLGQAMADDGRDLYGATCSLCHQAGGSGVPGQFPALAGRVDQIAATAQGRRYLAHVLLNGLSGEIKAGGQSYSGYMPSFSSQPDAVIAAVLTYIASLGATQPAPKFSANEITAARAEGSLAPAAILEERNKLNAAHPLP